jgi:protein-disulfide isomerase
MAGMLERVVNVVLAVGVVVAVGVLVRREMRTTSTDVGPAGVGGVTIDARAIWPAIRAAGTEVVPGDPITIVEIADLECPACRSFHKRLKDALAKSQGSVGFTFVHFPLENHRFARQASIALECIDTPERRGRFIDLAYAKQDSLGMKPWAEFALEAGMTDTVAFHECQRSTRPVARVNLGRAMGDSLEIRGTPTIAINGWVFPGVPSTDEIIGAIESIRRNEVPKFAK